MKRSIVVTGAARGIGKTIATQAAAQGYRVGVLDLDGEAAAQVAAELPDAVALAAATTDEPAVEAALDDFGAIDVMVNNAGVVRFESLLDVSSEDWRDVVDINLTGVFLSGRAAARRMPQGGSMINMASINGTVPASGTGAYAAAKAGVIMLTQHMAMEWGPLGIRVNSVAPGIIDAGMSRAVLADPAVREVRAGATPLRRLGTAEDIAAAVLFLASDEASFITAQSLVVDGGITRTAISNLPRAEGL
jgi:NAD(P)-dependent dehydrogenase (short-subunit alcohol dehydrogenase family)